ncbi:MULTISPECIES: hypothetical protein [Pseudonocardia]|uniref:hypothetical protein n=1 Tax=Pseudonocardia TaxID=1847 RepID=UPI001AD7983B|nr:MULTISPECIES: hypothetical protein [Pseudonocardia]MBO4236211.1 hypothetical protein [Pseudonocardia alni]
MPAPSDQSVDQFVRERFERPTAAMPTSAQPDVEAVRLGAAVARTRSGYTVISFHGETDISTDVLEQARRGVEGTDGGDPVRPPLFT